MGAMLYAIEAGGHVVFYGTDTAVLLEETWHGFRQRKMRFDVVILDHTYAPDQPGSDHMSAYQVIEHARRMRAEGVLDGRGRVFAIHIAPEGNPTHDHLTPFANQHGYDVAYDGLVLRV